MWSVPTVLTILSVRLSLALLSQRMEVFLKIEKFSGKVFSKGVSLLGVYLVCARYLLCNPRPVWKGWQVHTEILFIHNFVHPKNISLQPNLDVAFFTGENAPQILFWKFL